MHDPEEIEWSAELRNNATDFSFHHGVGVMEFWRIKLNKAFGGWGEASVMMRGNVEYVEEKIVREVVRWRMERIRRVEMWLAETLRVNREIGQRVEGL